MEHNIHFETIYHLNAHILSNNKKLDFCFVVPPEVFDNWKSEQSFSFHSVNIKVKKGEEIVWDGKFECGVLKNAILTAENYRDVNVKLNNGSAEIIIAGKNFKKAMKKTTGEKSVLSDSYTLTYSRQKNTSRYNDLSEELKLILANVTQKVICVSEPKKGMMSYSFPAALPLGNFNHLISLFILMFVCYQYNLIVIVSALAAPRAS
jgi:hypothetical protein